MLTIAIAIALFGPALIAFWSTRVTRFTRRRRHLAGTILLALCGAAAWWTARVPAALTPADLGVHAPTWATGPMAAALAATFVYVLGPWLMRLPAALGLSGFERALGELRGLPRSAVVAAVLVGGVVEELLYRGVALNGLGLLIGVGPAAVVTIAAFGAAHVPVWGPGPALSISLSGAILTGAYLVHGDVWANVLAHIAVDLVGLVASRDRTAA